MDGLYLLSSIASTLAKSAVQSLLLAVRSLPLLLSRAASSPESATSATLYEGHVRHERRRPVPHSFEYPVRYALVDLDRFPQPPHLSADRAREVAGTDGPVLFLTIPESVGYEQNPLSVYYCYGEEKEGSSRLEMCIAEVTNTPWGEKVFFSFAPGSDLVAKPLHVSPFMDMLGNWNIRADTPGEELHLAISVQHPTLGNYFNAILSAHRVYFPSNSPNLAIYFWLMPHKVAVWIYWQALKLWWKSVAFLPHPKYGNSRYRDVALLRDQELHCSLKIAECGNGLDHTSSWDRNKRWCVWRDAKWPWS